MKAPEKSPLYTKFTEEVRHSIQANNLLVTLAALEGYTHAQNKIAPHPLPGLIINGKKTNKAYLEINSVPGRLEAKMMRKNQQLCKRYFSIETLSQIYRTKFKNDHWRLYEFRLGTTEGYEGNGFAIALVHTMEKIIIPSLVDSLPDPQRVIAIHKDRAKGVENGTFSFKSSNNYRPNWTGSQLSELGYSNSPKDLIACMGRKEFFSLTSRRDYWVKILRK